MNRLDYLIDYLLKENPDYSETKIPESKLYKNLDALTKNKDQWEGNIPETDNNRVVRIHCFGQ